MFATGSVETSLPGENAVLVVPKTAVMWTGKRSVVFVRHLTSDGIEFVYRQVTLGPDLGKAFIVKEGLAEGEEIAVHGTFSIDAAAQLAGKPSMMNPGSGMTMTGQQHGGHSAISRMNESSLPTTIQKFTLTEQASIALQPLFTHYFDLKDHLVEDNFSDAVTSAKAFKAALQRTDMKVFSGDTHSAWMEFRSILQNNLEYVGQMKTIDALRQAFQGISNVMIAIAESFAPLDDEIYVQHCPMADSNRGADWLSKEKDIRNPYYGASMLRCGEVTKTIR